MIKRKEKQPIHVFKKLFLHSLINRKYFLYIGNLAKWIIRGIKHFGTCDLLFNIPTACQMGVSVERKQNPFRRSKGTSRIKILKLLIHCWPRGGHARHQTGWSAQIQTKCFLNIGLWSKHITISSFTDLLFTNQFRGPGKDLSSIITYHMFVRTLSRVESQHKYSWKLLDEHQWFLSNLSNQSWVNSSSVS